MKRTWGRRWMRIREMVLSANPLCVDCEAEGRTVAADEVDHIIPVHKGGTDDWENLAGRCHFHHNRKSRAEADARRGRMRGCDVDGTPLAWGMKR